MNIRTFTVLAIGMFIAMLSQGLVMPLLPIFADSLGASSVELGFIVAGSSVTTIAVMPFIGIWSDRYGRKLFICLALAIMSLSLFLMSFADSALDLILLRGLQGVAFSMLFPCSQALLGDMTPKGSEGKWMGYFNIAIWGGFGFGPIMGGVLHDWLNMSLVFTITAAITLLSFLITSIYLNDYTAKTTPKQNRSSFLNCLRNKVIFYVAIAQIALGLCTGATLVFLPLLGTKQLALSASMIGIILAARTPVSMLQSLTGKLADTMGAYPLVIAGGLISFIAFILLPWSVGFWSLMVLSCALALSTALAQPALSVYAMTEGRDIGMGTTMSISMMASHLGMGVGPVLMGQIVDSTNLATGFMCIGAMSLLGIILFATRINTGTNT